MKRPSFQFYPGDWRSNAKLRRCSHAERGIWLDVLCLMHDSEEYGLLRWPLRDIAQAVGCKVGQLRDLVSKGVLKGADDGQDVSQFVFVPRHAGRDGEPVTLIAAQTGPLWFSSRMVRDEYVRNKKAGIGGRFGEEPKGEPKPPIGYGASTSTSSSTSVIPLSPKRGDRKKPRTGCPDQFEVTPEMSDWAVAEGLPAEQVLPQTERFLDHHRAKGNTFADWRAAWKTWVKNAVEWGNRARSGS